LTFSDESGYVHEPNGIDASKLKTISKIKAERGAMLGRYVMSSTTAKFNEPESMFDSLRLGVPMWPHQDDHS
jgi:glutamate dehydrogenase (NADP+)